MRRGFEQNTIHHFSAQVDVSQTPVHGPGVSRVGKVVAPCLALALLSPRRYVTERDVGVALQDLFRTKIEKITPW